MNTLETLSHIRGRQPFKPFTVVLKDGTALRVDHPEYLAFRAGTAIYIDREGRFSAFDEDSIVRITNTRNGASRH